MLSNNDILLNKQNVKWEYLGFDVMGFLKSAQTAAAACRSQADIDAFNATYQPTIDKINRNRSLSLSAE